MGQDVSPLLIPRVRDGQKDVAITGFVKVRSCGEREYWVRLSAINRVDVDAKTVLLDGNFFCVHDDDWDGLLLALARGRGEV